MSTQIEATSFALAAIVGIVTQLLLASLIATFLVTSITAILIFQLLSHFSPTNYFENPG